ncbi:sperm motility kinase 2B-like [Mesocricetus auratus]|uniref:non-specific serine/threonine protein kinase n=1 Tax=Mesocricetus auratus TaxID=10036 RepID=A0ABM2WX05_MESAU|nr:sperm motility kinase 2B-like [Mesocricetus auratus]
MVQGRKACYSSEQSFMRDYKMMMTLGQGHFSLVKLALHVPTVTCVAIKVLRNEKKKNASLVAREVKIMKSLKHPNIIELFHVFRSRYTAFLVMEHAPKGDLFGHIVDRGSLEESEVRRLFTQILLAVEYCHSNHIAHRDINANNILLDSSGNAKLCDFGLAAKVSPGQLLKDFCGTPVYCAPELFAEEPYDGYAIDVWSLGVLLFLMVVGRFPFRGSSYDGVRLRILAANFSIPQHVSTDIFNVIVEMLMINPGRRPPVDQIMRRPMIRDSKVRCPPTSTQRLPGTLSTSIVSNMTAMGYKSEETIDSLREQNYNQGMATYPLQNQSPAGDCYHHQLRAMQPGLVLNLTDLHTFPVPLRRATEPARMAFSLSSNPQEREHEKNTRQVGTRHSMPATLFRHSERPQSPHLDYPNRRPALFLMYSREEMSESSSQSMIWSSGCLMDSIHSSSVPMYTDYSWPDHNETTGDTGSLPSGRYHEELGMTQQEDISEEVHITQEEAMNEEGTITQETTITQEVSITEEVTITHQEATTKEATIAQEEDMTREVTMTQDGNLTEEITMVNGATMSHIEEETIVKHEDILQEATVTLEVRRTQAVTMTQDDTVTEEEAITHGQPEVAGQASSQNRRRHRWKSFKKTMVNCLRHLCCCLPPARRSGDSFENLAPKKRDPAVTHRTSPEEVKTHVRGL